MGSIGKCSLISPHAPPQPILCLRPNFRAVKMQKTLVRTETLATQAILSVVQVICIRKPRYRQEKCNTNPN